MILYLESHEGERKWFKIVDQEDLNPVFAQFPMTREIALSCESLPEALDAIAEYLDGHYMHAWVEGTDLSKSIRSKAAALSLALATTMPTHISNTPESKPSLHPTPVATQEDKEAFGTHPSDPFLWNVMQIESSGGKNLKHKEIKAGHYKGQTAIGKWGLLKPTIGEIVGRMRSSGTLKPEYANLDSMSREQLNEHFQKNPKAELDLARNLATHVLKRQNGDQNKAAYAWLHGHNLFPSAIDQKKLMNSDYVNKYRSLNTVNPFNKNRAPSGMSKSELPKHDQDFQMRVKGWLKTRENELTDEPVRSSNFQPDPGRMRDDELDNIKPNSMKSTKEKLVDNIKVANKR
jgi:hypothetical protein